MGSNWHDRPHQYAPPRLPMFDWQQRLRTETLDYTKTAQLRVIRHNPLAFGLLLRHMMNDVRRQAASGVPVVAWDVQWRYDAARDADAGRVAVSVFATDNHVIVYQHATTGEDDWWSSFPREYFELLSSADVKKLGRHVTGDAEKMRSDLRFNSLAGGAKSTPNEDDREPPPFRELLDLLDVAELVTPRDKWRHGSGVRVSLRLLAQEFLLCDLDKEPLANGMDWEGELSAEKVKRAANDVVVTLQVFKAMMARAERLGIGIDFGLQRCVPVRRRRGLAIPTRSRSLPGAYHAAAAAAARGAHRVAAGPPPPIDTVMRDLRRVGLANITVATTSTTSPIMGGWEACRGDGDGDGGAVVVAEGQGHSQATSPRSEIANRHRRYVMKPGSPGVLTAWEAGD